MRGGQTTLTEGGVEDFPWVARIHKGMNAMNRSDQIDQWPLTPDPLPLRWDEGGVIRVGTGRVSLDLVVEMYYSGG